jgi:hypothetical protein
MSAFMVWVPPFVPLRRHTATFGYEGCETDARRPPCLVRGHPSDTGPAGARSARRGQGHQILCHPEAGGITEVVPADAADWDDGEPLGSRLEDKPREVHRGESRVDLAGRVDLAQAPDTGAERGEGLPEHRDGSREEVEKGAEATDQNEAVPEAATRPYHGGHIGGRFLPEARHAAGVRGQWRARLDPAVLRLRAVGGNAEQGHHVRMRRHRAQHDVNMSHERAVVGDPVIGGQHDHRGPGIGAGEGRRP